MSIQKCFFKLIFPNTTYSNETAQEHDTGEILFRLFLVFPLFSRRANFINMNIEDFKASLTLKAAN